MRKLILAVLMTLTFVLPISATTKDDLARWDAYSERLCLARTILYEAGGEPLRGKEAVAATVFERMAQVKYPSTVCSVVYQYKQYSWTSDRVKAYSMPSSHYLDMAARFLRQRSILRVRYKRVTHFHNDTVSPAWSNTFKFVMEVGNHKFYRME